MRTGCNTDDAWGAASRRLPDGARRRSDPRGSEGRPRYFILNRTTQALAWGTSRRMALLANGTSCGGLGVHEPSSATAAPAKVTPVLASRAGAWSRWASTTVTPVGRGDSAVASVLRSLLIRVR